jgi:high-affinity iron transporter
MAVDLSWLVRPGTVLAAVLTGVLGLQAQPTVIEAAVWLLYLVPMLLYVTWPSIQRMSRPAPKRQASRPTESREVSSRSVG